MDIYLVGGAVRDKLLNIQVKDHDWVVVGATAQQMLNQGFQQVGADFPVFLHPKTKEEYALARQERKKGHGYKGFECFFSPDVSLEDDLKRRDLTINAMAEDANGNIIDPFDGQVDLANRILRHVSDAFVEDPLRVLRVARFAARFHALGFTVAQETKALMKDIVAQGEIANLVPERVWQETQRALGEPNPATYFETLNEVGALEVLFKELAALRDVPQPAQHHPEIDTWVHTLLCLQQAVQLSESTVTRFAALIHDLGKGVTPKEEWPRHIAHEFKGKALVKALCSRIKAPNDYKDLALMVCEYHTHIHRAKELTPKTVLKVLNATDFLRKPERFQQFLIACEADARGRTGFENTPYPQRIYFEKAAAEAAQVDVKAMVAQGLKGAELGQALNSRREAIIKDIKQEFWSPAKE